MKEKGLMLVFLTAVISGFSIFINKFGVSGINPFVFAWLKNTVVAVFLISAILLLKDIKLLKEISRKNWAKLVAIGLIGGSIPFLLFFKGLQMTVATSAAFIHKTLFIYAAILAALFLKEKMNKKIIIAAVFILAGNALLLKTSWNLLNIGDLMILAATVLWAGENVLSKHTLKDVSPRIVAFGRMFFGSLFILAFLLLTGNIIAVATLTVQQLLWVLVTSAFLLLYVLTWYNGLKYLKVYVATSILLLGSVITTILSVLFTGTAITLSQAFGMLLLVSGVIYIVGLASIVSTIKQIIPWSRKHGWR
ncbi:MAG: DMT family transporter [bacterium]|nr:DMT family transporter [bacterium]